MEEENVGLEIMKVATEIAVKEGVNSLDQAIRNFFPYWGQKRAAADAYIDDIRKSNLPPECKLFLISNTKKTFRKMQNQMDIAYVARSALVNRHGENYILPPITDNELLLRLMDSGKFVSDADLKLLWGNILAGELDAPGSTPKSVVGILSDLDKKYARIFADLCSLQIDLLVEAKHIGSGTCLDVIDTCPMIILNNDTEYLSKMNITHDTLQELNHFGLINFASVGEYSQRLPRTYIHLTSERSVM